MALDTRGIVDGAVQGFGLMDRYYRGQHQDNRAERRLGMQEDAYQTRKDQAQQASTKDQATFVLGKIAQGVDPTKDEMQFLQDHPQFWPALDPQTDKSIEVAQSVIDPSSRTSPNDPQALDAMNQLWGHRINRGDGGAKRISGLYPGQQPGTVAIDLSIDGKDGKTYNAPMTRNRGTKGDDEVLQTPVEALVNQVQGYRMLRNAFRTPEAQAQATKVLSALTGKQQDKTKPVVINGKLVNPNTGAVIGDYNNADSKRYGEPFKHPQLGWVQPGPNGKLTQLDSGGKGGSGSKAPADVQTAEWMVRTGVAKDLSEAWDKIKTSTVNPAKYVSDYVGQMLKNQEAQGVFPSDPNYRTPEQLRSDAMESLKTIRAYNSDPQDPQQQQPAGLTMTKNGQGGGLPADGSAVPDGKGGYKGKVDRSVKAQNPPTPEAIQHLKDNPDLAPQFKEYYGFLPEGF